ncbi:hypothetical protein D3C78_835040 [compost metagenome]
MVGAVEQDQQIDVGVGVQLAATVAADRDQRDVGVCAPVELLPGLLQDVVDEPGAVLDQAADIPAAAKTPVEHLARLADRLLEGCDRARLQGQFSLELAAVEEFGIHLRHRLAFLSIYIGSGRQVRLKRARWCHRRAG